MKTYSSEPIHPDERTHSAFVGAGKDPLFCADSQYVLLVDDSPADARLVYEAFEELGMGNRCVIAKTPSEAIAMLDSSHLSGMTPRLVLLNLDVSGGRGGALLKQLKSMDAFCEIPVIVMAENDKAQTIRQLYRNYANACVVKPTSFTGYVLLVRNLVRFWFETVCLPPGF